MLSAPTTPDCPSFDSIESALRRAGAPIDAAEVHGYLCGMLCVLGDRAPDLWLGEVLADAGGDAVLVDEAGTLMTALATAAREALQDPEMSFQPLLPPDREPLEYQVSGLGVWCLGFNRGLAEGASVGDAGKELGADDVAEIIDDFAALSLADASGTDPEEETEAALAELVEYVRVGVQVVFDALTPVRTRLASTGTH